MSAAAGVLFYWLQWTSSAGLCVTHYWLQWMFTVFPMDTTYWLQWTPDSHVELMPVPDPGELLTQSVCIPSTDYSECYWFGLRYVTHRESPETRSQSCWLQWMILCSPALYRGKSIGQGQTMVAQSTKTATDYSECLPIWWHFVLTIVNGCGLYSQVCSLQWTFGDRGKFGLLTTVNLCGEWRNILLTTVNDYGFHKLRLLITVNVLSQKMTIALPDKSIVTVSIITDAAKQST